MGRDRKPPPSSAASGSGSSSTAKPAPAHRKPAILKSGNSTAPTERPPQDPAKPSFFPGWTGKTPLTLLNERCQKEGWMKPELSPHVSLIGARRSTLDFVFFRIKLNL
jgi:ATP-dependent RNA helicase DHX57